MKNKIIYLLLFIAFFSRFYNLGTLPEGLNQDEAYAGYEALTLLTSQIDSWGYHFPVYFVSWGSGMNVLYSYILVPFFYIFGVKIWVLRFPQAIFAIISCYVFYRLLRLIYSKKEALVGLFLIAIMPWHIMLSRWGLEANLAPSMILFGFYFFCRSLKKINYLYLSALFYALAMYAYATCWIFVVATFAFQLSYLLIYHKKIKTILMAGFLYTLCVFPLGLLILVNNFVIEEINTAYFSVPKLLYWRSSEIGFDNLSLKQPAFWNIFLAQDDNLITNRIPKWGMFYKFSLIFILWGIWGLSKKAYKDVQNKSLSIHLLVLVEIVIGIIYAITLYPCINRLNYLWMFILIALTIGVIESKKYIFVGALSAYAVSFILFIKDYVFLYNNLAASFFSKGIEQSIAKAETEQMKNQQDICVIERGTIYPQIMFLNKIPQAEYQSTIRWKYYPQAYLEATSVGHYHFIENFDYYNIPLDCIYIIPKNKAYYFYQFDIWYFGNYAVAVANH